MKKILTIITATAILATSSFSAEITNTYLKDSSLEKKGCDNFKNIRKELLLSEDIKDKHIGIIISNVYSDEATKAQLGGDSSLEFLKGKNLGIKQNINFSTIAVSYIKFLKFLYKNNSEEDLRKTALFLNLIESTTRNRTITEDIQTAYVFTINHFLQNLEKYKSFSSFNFLKTFISKNNFIDEKYREITTEFLKTIIFEDFEKAIDLIKNFEDISELKDYAENRCNNVLKESNYENAVKNTNIFYYENKTLKYWTFQTIE